MTANFMPESGLPGAGAESGEALQWKKTLNNVSLLLDCWHDWCLEKNCSSR